jgi:peptide-methionine (S)-S-oxide reductase
MRLRSDTEFKTTLIPADQALPGRIQAIPTAQTHFVNGAPLKADLPAGADEILFAMGCFWGVERIFWQMPGVLNTAAGYAGGITPNPTYEEVCSGRTGHTEAVRVVFDPKVVSVEDLLVAFWEGHDPTQAMRQGNDIGTQYRSAIYWTTDAQREAGPFYFAEADHQQYLAKNPGGYCGLGGTGVACPIGVGVGAR